MGHSEDDRVGWILTLSATATCAAGSLVIFSDSVWNRLFPKHRFSLSDNRSVLTASLGLSSGVLLFTALYRLLPDAHQYFAQSPVLKGDARATNAMLLGTFALGIVICASFNTILHMVTSKSIVHCNDHGNSDHATTHAPMGGHQHSSHSHDAESLDESTPLIEAQHGMVETQMMGDSRLRSSKSIIDFMSGSINKRLLGKCMGYTNIEDCACLMKSHEGTCTQSSEALFPPEEVVHHHHRLETENDLEAQYGAMIDTHGTSDNLDSIDADHSHSHEEDHHHHHHHHHILTQYSHLFSIGIQTALAITIHKVPEGFLTFASNHADRQVGLNVFIALSIHNFSEGFSVAFPLFLALKSRAKAFLIATLLCGISQPIGALLAMLLFKHKIDARQTDFVFGIIVSVTAGFMTIIGMQMYGTSIYYGSHQWAVTTWFVVGMVLIGATTIIMP